MCQSIKKAIVTLGPSGTDAEHAAKILTDSTVCLTTSFEDAMREAYQKDLYALLCCGYKGRGNEAWVDLNFRYYDSMRIVSIHQIKTKEMAIAKRKGITSINTMAIHPSTEEFAKKFINKHKLNLTISYFNNKPSVVSYTSDNKFDLCIGSVDVIEKYSNLEILESFQPEMIWTLYEKIS